MSGTRKAKRSEAHTALPFPPRCLDPEQAAAYCGISANMLRQYGPQPLRIGSRMVWDLRALDTWLDGLAGRPGAGAENEAERAMLEALG